jgi:hypothetical protein
LQELNKVDGEEISFKNLSSVLEPFLNGISNCRNRILVQRIKEKIFMPLLENNITPIFEEENSESESEHETDKNGQK